VLQWSGAQYGLRGGECGAVRCGKRECEVN
jgi:hypothetical protein